MADTLNTKLSPKRKPEEKKTLEGQLGISMDQQADELEKNPDYLEGYRELARDPEYVKSAPLPTRNALQQAIDKAEANYEKRTTRNDWLEVAQMLGRAVAQYGAARQGVNTGRNMSGLEFMPGIDYNARNDRTFRDYQAQLRNAQTLDDAERRARAEDRENELFNLRDKKETRLETERTKKADEREARADKREEIANRRIELQELNNEEKSLAGQLKARQALVNQIQQEDDLTSSSAKKLQEKYGMLAAQGDMDLATLQSELAAATKPGRIWGTNPDPEKQATILQSKVEELRNLLDAVRARKKQIVGGGSAPAGPKPGDIVDGYEFLGGNPADQKNWKQVKK